MKPISKKVLESGLIDKNAIQLLERWGNLPAGTSERIRSDVTKEQLKKFSEELSALIEAEPILRETDLSLQYVTEQRRIAIGTEEGIQVLMCGISKMGNLLFKPQSVRRSWLTVGNDVLFPDGIGDSKEIMNGQIVDVSEVFVESDLIAYRVQIST